MTGQELINLVLKDLGEIDGDETPTTSESNDGLATANHILSSWSNKGLIVPTRKHDSFTLTAGTSAYTMGPGATWATAARPMRIEAAEAASGNFRNGIRCLAMDEYRDEVKSGSGVTSVLPEILGFDNARPTINIRVFPPPNTTGVAVEVDYWTALAAIATLATAIDLAEGFEWALRTAMRVALSPMYGHDATQTMTRDADLAMANIQEINAGLKQASPQAAQ